MSTAIKLGPHTHEARDVPRHGALSLLQKPLHPRGVQHNSSQAFVQWALAKLLPAPAFTRCLVVLLRPLPALPLVGRPRYLIVVAQADTCGAGQVLDRGAQADARGAARWASQLLLCGALTDAGGATIKLGPRDVPRCGALSLI
jgi:hypothetical protein